MSVSCSDTLLAFRAIRSRVPQCAADFAARCTKYLKPDC